jgi:hypothetical protein
MPPSIADRPEQSLLRLLASAAPAGALRLLDSHGSRPRWPPALATGPATAWMRGPAMPSATRIRR